MAVDPQMAGIGLVDSAQDLHQGRFARAVFARQRDDLARTHLEVDTLQRHHAGESLGDPLHFEHGRVHPQGSAAPTQTVDSRHELVDVVLFDDQGWNDLLLVRGDRRAVAPEHPGDQMNRLVAELVGLLNDGRIDGPLFDSSRVWSSSSKHTIFT